MKEIKNLLIAVNSTSSPTGDKYPFGSVELTAKLKQLEQDKKIAFNPYEKTWKLK